MPGWQARGTGAAWVAPPRGTLVVTERDWTPTDEDLRAFDRGLLADEAADAVVRWLEAHPQGEERLRRLTEPCPDAVVEALRKPCRINEELTGLSGVASRVIDHVLDE